MFIPRLPPCMVTRVGWCGTLCRLLWVPATAPSPGFLRPSRGQGSLGLSTPHLCKQSVTKLSLVISFGYAI